MSSFVWKIAMCNIRGMNNPAKQADVICWHKEMDNMISIITETKLKGRIHSWIANRFPGVHVFVSSLNSGYLGSGVAIVMNIALTKHVCKISKIPGRLLSVRLLFKNKLSVSVLGLYAGALLLTHFLQASNVNALISKAVNEFFLVILGGNFNENGSHKSASFKKCDSLGLVNFFIVNHGVLNVGEFFDTDHQSISVLVGLGDLLDTHLCSLRKQTNKDHWKYNFKNADTALWLKFREVMVVNTAMFSNDFVAANELSDLDAILSRFHKLELLISKLVRASHLVNNDNFVSLLNTWELLDFDNVVMIRSLFLFDLFFNNIHSVLSKVRKFYCASKLSESKRTKESQIRSAIEKKMESFVSNKSHIIRSVLERSFHKVVLDYLVIGDELILEPDPIKFKVDKIMEDWTRKCGMVLDILENWSRQYWPLNHVFDSAFSDVMSCVGFDELFGVVSNLPDSKATGLLGISNELWKHCNILVLGMLLVLINSCLSGESVPRVWKEAWEGIFMNTCPIVLIETAWKILSKIFFDRIFLACNKFDILHENNFSSPIFAIGLVVEDALEKNWELWLVLQDMRKAYDLKSLIRIKMYSKFIWFFGGIHGGHTNWIITNFGLTDGYCVHDGLDQREVFSLLLWHIFYDPLLCEVKRQESVCGYRLNSHFVAKTGHVKSQAGSTSFFAVGAFMDDTIWIGSNQVATQYILNIASEFFQINDISINNDKTVAISINCRVVNPSLLISGAPILVAKKGEPYHYLGIFLSTESLSQPSLAKAHSDQIQAECKSASVVSFANSGGILGCLFLHRSYELQVLSWHPIHPLVFLAYLKISLTNNFLAGVIHIFRDCSLSLSDAGPSAFWFHDGTPMFLVLASSVQNPLLGNADVSSILNSIEFGLVHDHLSGLSAGCISVYTDGSLSGLGSVNIRSGAAVFFDDINIGMGVKVSDLMSFTLAELQAIALTLKCVPVFSSVSLFSDSQAALDAYRFELNHSGNFGNDHANELAGHATSSNLILSSWLNERYILAGDNIVSGNSRHFIHDIFHSIHCLCWKYGSGTNVVTQDLLADINWWRSASVWHPNSHMAAGPTSKCTAGIRTYFMKALHRRLPITVCKHLYDRGYPSVICLFCGCVEVSDHVFFCDADTATHVHLLEDYAMIWENISGLCHSTFSVLQFLSSCVLNTLFYIALCKGFVFKRWFHEAVFMFGDSKSAEVKVVNFVCALCFAFRDEIWSVYAKHRAFIEKHNLIPRNSSLFNSKSGLSFVYSAGVIRLLGIDVALGVSFGFRRFSLFISNAFDVVSVSISA
ncbi:hypothetical protein G9A89_019944 [Geosiphon pyriformis]|nr:hypothetical protein G9A89_019944 [Geosiphon pyriformis]